MRYVIADTDRARACGISAAGHRTNAGRVLLNEKELAAVAGATAEEKAANIGGRLYTNPEIRRTLREGGWNG